MRYAPLLATALLLAAGATQARMYKWVDENGQVHYGERPPAGVEYRTVAPPPPPASSAPEERQRLEKAQEFLDQNRQARDEAKKEAARKKAEAERRRQNCAAARKNLEMLTYMTGRKRMVGPDGVAYKMTEEERQARMAKARKQIQQYCKEK